MSKNKKTMTAEQAATAMDEVLTRLERAVFNRTKQVDVNSGEQATYIEQLELENKKMARDLAEMKKNCIALKKGYELLEGKYAQLEDVNDSAEKELVATLHELDQFIARKSLH